MSKGNNVGATRRWFCGSMGTATLAAIAAGLLPDASAAPVVNGSAKLEEADKAASEAGLALNVPPGIHVFDASYTFTAPVIVAPGALIRTSGPSIYLKFAAGFQAGLFQCLDTDGPTQFLATERIYPQWFGRCGGATDDSSAAMNRAFRACRASFNTSSDKTDTSFGCRTVWFPSGTYRCRNVVVYAGTNIDGEWGGSPYGPTLLQIDYRDPGLRFVPKNYALSGEVINTSVGQNHIQHVRLGTETPAGTFEGQPICHFMSPKQASAYLQIKGDGIGADVGHIDTQFIQTWWKNGNTCIMADEGMLWVHIRDSTFDVVFRAVQHKGSARGFVRSYNNIYYGCLWGALENQSSDTTKGVGWNSFNDEFKAGTPAHADPNKRRALNYNPSAYVPGTTLKVSGSTFLRQDSLGYRIGGPIFAKQCEHVEIDCTMHDPDCTVPQKAIAIQDGVRHLSLRGSIVSKKLDSSYANAQLVAITQASQSLVAAHIAMDLSNDNATSMAHAVHADFPLKGLDLSGTVVRGAFTSPIDPVNILRPTGWS